MLNSQETKTDRLKHQELSSNYHKLVDGNLILRQGILSKKVRLVSHRRMFLLTEGPKFYYIDPLTMSLKGEIPFTRDLKTQFRDSKLFLVQVPGRTYHLTDKDGNSQEWCDTIKQVKHFYFKESEDV